MRPALAPGFFEYLPGHRCAVHGAGRSKVKQGRKVGGASVHLAREFQERVGDIRRVSGRADLV